MLGLQILVARRRRCNDNSNDLVVCANKEIRFACIDLGDCLRLRQHPAAAIRIYASNAPDSFVQALTGGFVDAHNFDVRGHNLPRFVSLAGVGCNSRAREAHSAIP